MGAQSSRVEQPDVVFPTIATSRKRFRHHHQRTVADDNDHSSTDDDDGNTQCFFGGRFPGLKPLLESPLLTTTDATTTRTIKTKTVSSKEDDDSTAPTTLMRDSATSTIISLQGGSPVIRIRQLNGCDDQEMEQFLHDLFNNNNVSKDDDDDDDEESLLIHQEDDSTLASTHVDRPSSSSSFLRQHQHHHRRQRTHETNHYLSSNAAGWVEGDNDDDDEVVAAAATTTSTSRVVAYGSPPEVLSSIPTTRGRNLCRQEDLDSITSDSEASTPCSSPISLHGGKKDSLPPKLITEDFLLQEEPLPAALSAPLGRNQPRVSSSSFFEEQEQEQVASSSSLQEVLSLSPPDLISTQAALDRNNEVIETAQRIRLSNLADQLESQGRLLEALHFYELVFEHDEVFHTASLDEVAGVHLKIGIVHWKMSTYDACLDALNRPAGSPSSP